MADMKPIQYTSRDGLTIHGYLTLPRGFEAKNLPAVLLVHGGPWARDTWGFDPEAQFLANRGYAVLQVNFRGSTGYGREFWEISFKRWGKEMQNDLTDGVNWLVDQGIADPDRVGIYGASYGGYAVLAGLAFTPDLYACGVNYVGVSNLFTLLESIPPYWELGRQMFYEMMGNPETEADLLREISPLFHADKITAPLIVFQGANDIRCKKPEADQIVRALRDKGIDVPYMVKDNEGHGFRNEENRFDVYRAMEHFLAQHLGGRVEEGTVMPEMNGVVDPLPGEEADEAA
jgi:dipeptidyl aminopeptidase/acylaminoacyl peptidase